MLGFAVMPNVFQPAAPSSWARVRVVAGRASPASLKMPSPRGCRPVTSPAIEGRVQLQGARTSSKTMLSLASASSSGLTSSGPP